MKKASFSCVNMVGYTGMKLMQQGAGKPAPVKIAEKNLHCYSCGGLIRKGSLFLRKDFVKTHYKQCPVAAHVSAQDLRE